MASPISSPNKRNVISKIKGLHIPFVANQGQAAENVKFYARTFGGNVYVTGEGEIVYRMQKSEDSIQNSEEGQGITIKEQLIGSKNSEIKGEGAAATKVSYFRGNDPAKWLSDIPTFDFVNLGEVYDGIELKLKAYGNNVEKLFYVKPGAESSDIQMNIDGVTGLKVNDDGELVAETENGDIRFTKPVAFQEIGGERTEVAVQYVIASPQSITPNTQLAYSFIVGDYDKSKELVIDPLLASTYLTSRFTYTGAGEVLAIDAEGNIFVAGDDFVAKYSNDLSTLIASAFIRGGLNIKQSISEDGETGEPFIYGGHKTGEIAPSRQHYIHSIAIDHDGNIYVGGDTQTSDFPVTPEAYDTSFNSSWPYLDGFVAKIDNDLSTLLASTYLGGSGIDRIYSIALDSSGNVYASGQTDSSNFPTTAGAYADKYNGGISDVFVSKLDGDLSNLLSSTFLGGELRDYGGSLVLGQDGGVYVTGGTTSTDFPVMDSSYDASHNGSVDVFLSKLSGDLSTLLASTFLGGSDRDEANSIVLDLNGNIYVAGDTESDDFPLTPGSYNSENDDFFVSKLDKDLTLLLASTSMGSRGYANIPFNPTPLALDSDGNVYFAGTTLSKTFPVTPGFFDSSLSGITDGFISKLDNDLTTLFASTYLGGRKNDGINALAVASDGMVYAAGHTFSSDLPTTKGSFDRTFDRHEYGPDGFVSKFDFSPGSAPLYALTIINSDTDSGSVTSAPAGMRCGNICAGQFVSGTKLRLSAKPNTGFVFLEWGGACAGVKGNCVLTTDADKTVIATFKKLDVKFSVAPSVLDFGETTANVQSKKKILKIINKGKGILNITGVSLEGTEFSTALWQGEKAVLPKKSFAIAVMFTPTSAGNKTAALTLTFDDSLNSSRTITLKGRGVESDDGNGGDTGGETPNPFAGMYSGTFVTFPEEDGINAGFITVGTLSFIVSIDGKVNATITKGSSTVEGRGSVGNTGNIMITSAIKGESFDFAGSVSEKDGKVVGSGGWSTCPICYPVQCGAPCMTGGTWTAQKQE